MAFRSAEVPEGHVIRSYRVKVMSTRAKHRRARGMLVAGGDAWAFCIDRFHERIRAGLPNANSLVQLWPDQKAHGPFGDLSAHCAQDVTKAWSAAYFQTMRRRKLGEEAALPLKKRYLFPVTWRKGEFTLHRSTGRERGESRARHPKGSGEPGSRALPRPPLRPRARALRAPEAPRPASSSWTSQPGWRWSRQRPPPAS